MTNRPAILTLVSLAAALCLVLPCCYEPVVGGDLWWHLASGRLIAQSGRIPAADVFSFSAAHQPWLNHEWLAQVGLWGLWSRLGPDSLAYAKVLLLLAVFALVFVRGLRLGAGPVAALAATVLAAYVAKPFLDVRPGLLSLAGAALVLLLWERRRPRPLLAVPLLLLLWANLHAGVVFGLIVSGLFAAEALLWRQGEVAWLPPRTVAAALALALLLPLANPNGAGLYLFPFSYAPGSAWKDLHDWLPPRPGLLPVSPLFWPYLAAVVFALVTAWRKGWRASALSAALAAALALLSMRFIPLLAVVSAPLLALAGSELAGWLSKGFPHLTRAVRPAGWGLGAAVAGLCALVLSVTPWRGPLLATMTKLETFPAAAVEFLQENDLKGRPFHPFGWGGYLMLARPEQPVFIDQRANTVYSEAHLADYLRVAQLEPGYREVLSRWGIDLILWPSRDLLPALLVQGGGWVPVWRDGVATVLVRAGSPLLSRLEALSPTWPRSPYALYAQGLALAEAGRLGEAEQALLAAAPAVPAARSELGRLYGQFGRPEEGYRLLRQSAAAYPYQMGLNLSLSRLAQATGRPWEARARRLAELLLFPYNPNLWEESPS